MDEPWNPSVRIWPFADAPEEFRHLSPWGDGTEQLLIYIPEELSRLLEDDNPILPPAFWFLGQAPKFDGHIQYANDGVGWYCLCLLPCGGCVAITTQNDD